MLKGLAQLREPLLNKGTAFTQEERAALGLFGLLPSHVETIEDQLLRCRDAYSAKQTPLEKHIYLRALQDHNEVLFYHFVLNNLVEMLPILYTPVVGEACQFFHHIYRQSRGLFISYPEREHMDEILAGMAKTRTIRVIVVTDGERILGLGDQGVGGLGIPIGKLSLYTACGGVAPGETLPIVLDVGTNNQDRLNDNEYFGWRHPRLSGQDYTDFVDCFVNSVKKHYPNVLLQFEDFAQQHAYPLLDRYRNQLCMFNDDIQGTAAVALSAILAACRVADVPLKEQRIALLGAGSAGCGISEQLVRAMVHQGLSEAEARERFYLVDRNGLLHNEMTGLAAFQIPFARSKQALSSWRLAQAGHISLQDVIDNAKPTILLGVSGQPNQFTEPMIRKMASECERPIVFPLSNPTSRAEAVPQDILEWTDGKALIATGSPFNAVSINGQTIEIAQCNNSYIFPGMGLAVVVGNIQRITDGMMMAAALALSELSPAVKTGQGRLLPTLSDIREVSQHIACAVILQAIEEGHAAPIGDKNLTELVRQSMWQPNYSSKA